MKIEKVHIQNFAILNKIDLNLSDKAGSLIFLNGSNGRGKSTFQSALRWCFYGDEPVSSKFLSNYALHNANVGDTLTTCVEVEVKMDSAGTSAVINRSVSFQKTDSTIPKRFGQPQLSIKVRKSESGSFTDIQADPELWLRKFFPERLVNYFLFDGEKMEKFFDVKVKGAVENAIREIAGVDLFDNIAKNMAAVETGINKKIAKLTGTKAEKINIELEAQQRLLVQIFLEYTKLDEELKSKKARHEDIALILENLKGQEDAAMRLKDLDKEESYFRESLERAEEEFQSEILTNGTNSLLASSFPIVKALVAKAEAEDWLPPPFEPDRIKKLIEDQMCICGTHLNPGDEATRALEDLMEKHRVTSGVGKLLSSTATRIAMVELHLQNGWKTIQDKNTTITEFLKQIDRIQKEKNRLLDLMKGSDVTEIRLLVDERKQLDRDKERLQKEIAILLGQNESQTFKVESLKQQLSKASEGNAEAQSLQGEADWARKISSAAGKIHQSAIELVRQRLELTFTEKFSVIKSGKFVTEITRDFEVVTRDEFGNPTELSEGEKMMKAYVFAICLREVIGLSFPLIVDTPFGKLSSRNRAELAKMLCKFLEEEVTSLDRQAIFLMQDTEYTPYTKKYFAGLEPVEAYLASDKANENSKSDLGFGIDPDWLQHEAWKDWAERRIG
jgi:DNA sulfur modification protein DndD